MQAYLDSIKAKTGKTVDDFIADAERLGLTTYKDMMVWLKGEVGLGHGHANLIAQLVTKREEIAAPQKDKLDALFSGVKAHWRPVYNGLAAQVGGFGVDAGMRANRSYINLQKAGKNFGFVLPATAKRLDIGLKLKGQAASGILEDAGSWNTMVTHRIQIASESDVTDEVIGWLRAAYAAC